MTFVLHIYICNYYSQSEMEIYMSENDFRKQLLLNEFKTLSKGKNKEEIVPLIFALSQKAKQAGIQFTRQDCNMAFGLKLRKVPKDEIDKSVHEAAKILDIEHLLDRKPKALSGGQRQRVAMGRAIVRSPKVFLMDEPLSNLDAKLRVQMRVEISKLHKRLQTTIIYVTHDQTEAMTLGTRIVVLKDGIIQQVDTPQNLYNTPNNIFVAGFIGSPQMNLIDATVAQEGSQAVLKMSEEVVIKLPAEKSKKLIDEGYVGKTVVVGIRPEDVKDDPEFIAAHQDTKFKSTIRVYELLGAEVNLHYEIGDVTCTAKVNPRTTARPGDEVEFAMDVARLHVFDKETEMVITH